MGRPTTFASQPCFRFRIREKWLSDFIFCCGDTTKKHPDGKILTGICTTCVHELWPSVVTPAKDQRPENDQSEEEVEAAAAAAAAPIGRAIAMSDLIGR